MSYKKIADSLRDFVKQAEVKSEELIKTAEDKELYEKGKIFGMGMAEGFLEKIAQELGEVVEPQLPPTAPAEPVVAPQQVPAEPVDTELDTIKQIMKSMTPVQLAQWLLAQDAGTLEIIAKDPELAAMADEALKVLESAEDSEEEAMEDLVADME